MLSSVKKDRDRVDAEPDHEVDVRKGDSRQVCQVGDSGLEVRDLEKYLDTRIEQNCRGRPHRENAEDENPRVRKERGKAKKKPENGP